MSTHCSIDAAQKSLKTCYQGQHCMVYKKMAETEVGSMKVEQNGA